MRESNTQLAGFFYYKTWSAICIPYHISKLFTLGFQNHNNIKCILIDCAENTDQHMSRTRATNHQNTSRILFEFYLGVLYACGVSIIKSNGIMCFALGEAVTVRIIQNALYSYFQ